MGKNSKKAEVTDLPTAVDDSELPATREEASPEPDLVDEIVAERSAANPDFKALLEEEDIKNYAKVTKGPRRIRLLEKKMISLGGTICHLAPNDVISEDSYGPAAIDALMTSGIKYELVSG